ncbi:acyltransferase family protein [Paracoccus sp. (in: a-proteobacteria)]|uniref:acyltransferase family protein n=1 Tax=Paracoccus sp. TaxID=267 RepID=UPI0026DEF9CE|nr:acyltransferase [Paracoccus sp. (in: a-proteobacteria)]MDO5647747.1 acyltransferase [Paracoccus sp. (in: a-proteobacteria)]
MTRPLRYPVETARLLAVLCLVSYHVIGPTGATALQQGYPSPLRIFADLLIDVRMPLFAAISGLLYAIRPPQISQLTTFFRGKAARLLVPGAVAIILFIAFSNLLNTPFALHDNFHLPFVQGYAHFWFLQAIFVIFLVFAPLDAALRQRFSVPIMLAGLVAVWAGLRSPVELFSAQGAVYLFPYFLLGVNLWRYRDWIASRRGELIIIAATALSIGVAWNIATLHETGQLSLGRYDLQSILTSVGVCVVVFLTLPQVPALAGFGAVSFTIYLYHVFGTSGARRLAEGLGVTSIPVIFVLGVAAGFAVPWIIHRLSSQHPITRGLVLGQWPRRSISATPATATAQ